MKRLRSILIFSFVPMIIFSSCAINRNYQARAGLHYSGTYTVKAIRGSQVQFKEVAGIYRVDPATLKPGDRITINVIRDDNGSNKIVSSQTSIVKN